MVNEINKPPTTENIILGERLAESNRQLREMQEEHRMLLNEMQTLRQRAADLARLNAEELVLTQQQQEVQTEAPTSSMEAKSDNDSTEQSEQAVTAQEVDKTDNSCDAAEATANEKDNSNEHTDNDGEDKDDPETAEYIQKKIAEIAAMKAQYKRVQDMINTTNLIEQHLGSSSEENDTATSTSGNNAALPTSAALIETLTADAAEQDTTQRLVNDENGELISAMMNMFTDFTSDLRSQAENLRAERDRIRALKEELLRRKRQS